MPKFHPGLQEVVDVRTYRRTIFAKLNLLDALTTKFSYPWCSAARAESAQVT